MPHDEPTIDAPLAAAQDTAVHPREPAPYEGFDEEDEWLEQPAELPPRPRRRLLGVGGNRSALALIGVLLIACGFTGGALVEKGQASSSSSAGGAATGLASRFAALRAGTSGTASRSAAAGAASGFPGTGAGRPTAGTVAYLSGNTLYVTDSEGNTVKVKTSAATSVTKTAKASVSAIHPGETVSVTGTSGSGGAISAEAISVGSAAGTLASLFGGSGASSDSTGSSSAGAGATPSLFGGG
jgi:hypothetical protein